MSYILDALRRAEAERERGNVPGLHSPGLPAGGTAPSLPALRQARAVPWWLIAFGVVLAVTGAALGAWWASRSLDAVPRPAVAIESASPAAARGNALPAGAARGLTPPPLSAAASGPAPGAQTPLRLPTPPVAAAAPVVARAPAPVDLPAPRSLPPTEPGQRDPPSAAALPEAPSPSPAPPTLRPDRTPTGAVANTPTIPLAALAPELRAAWPPLVIGGSIYSDNPPSRFIIANGQVVREGQSAAPGVLVERIGRNAVVLQWRGMRVEVPV